MALTKRVGQFNAHSFAREGSVYCFSFNANETFDGTTLSQDEGVISAVTRDSDGLYTVTFNQRFKKIRPLGVPSVRASTEFSGNYDAIVEGGSSVNSVSIAIRSASALDDPDVVVDCALWLVTSDTGLAT